MTALIVFSVMFLFFMVMASLIWQYKKGWDEMAVRIDNREKNK